MPTVDIEIRGLRQFESALQKLESETESRLVDAGEEIADLIVRDARRRVPSRSGRARKSIRTFTGGRKVTIEAGGQRAPYFGWLDFGGRIGPRQSVRRRYSRRGRYIFDSLGRKNRDMIDVLDDGLRDAARDAGWEVH